MFFQVNERILNLSKFSYKVTKNNANIIYIIPLVLIILIEFYSLHYAQFHYDGLHVGLLLNVASDLDSGKLMYRDFWYEYGVLNGYLNLLILKVANYNIFSLFLVYSQFYVIGIILLYLLTNKFFGTNYATLFLIVLFIIHPYLIKPWHNYILFFLISAFLFMKSFFNLKYDAFSSLILGLAFLFSETFFLTSFLILAIDLIYSYKIFGKKIILEKIILFLLPIILFFIYLFSNNLIGDWLLSKETFPHLLKYFYKTDIFTFIINNLKVFLFSYKNIYSDTIYFFYSIIYLSNFIFIIINLKKIFKNEIDNQNLFFLLIASVNLILISQILSNLSTFKLATLSSFGFIIIIIFIKSVKETYLRKLLISIIILFSLNSFFDSEKEWISNKYHYSENNIKFDKFDFLKSQKYPLSLFQHLEKFNQITLDIKKKCDIKFFANFTEDSYYYYLTRDKFEFSQFLYWYRNEERYYQNSFFISLARLFDKNFSSKINAYIKKKNVFFITDASNKDKIFYIDQKIYFKDNFNYIYLPYSSAHSYKVVLIPKNCSI